jgi:Notch-like protein
LTPCKNSGQCYFLPDAAYYCVCYSGYSGNNCQFSAMTTTTTTPATYNPCLSARPCLNGGTCLPKGNQGEFTCMCPQGYTGVNCQSLSNRTRSENIFILSYI